MKIVFMGTPHFAKICLEHLLNSHHNVIAVVCATDKPSGRGNKLSMPEVKTFALEKNIPVYQFEKIRFEGVEILKSLNADIFVTASFGQILSQEIIDIPKYKIINVHGSLLPKYRGASPIQTALLHGEKMTGVTIMRTDAGVDTGDILLQQEFEIFEEDNSETLMNRCANIGGKLLIKALDLIESGQAVYKKQDEFLATKTKMFKKENSKINFEKTANKICNKIRAYAPSPACYFNLEGEKFLVYRAKKTEVDFKPLGCGQIVVANPKQGLIISCLDGFIEILELKPANKKIMSAKDFLNGRKLEVGKFVE